MAPIFAVVPSRLPTFHFACATSFLPVKREMVIGMRYPMASAMTPTDAKAVKALLEPRLIRPSNISTAVTSVREYIGRSAKVHVQRLARGSALSRLNAHVQWEAAFVIAIAQKSVTNRIIIIKIKAPVFDPMMEYTTYGSAWP